jgi:hypothetical protein
LLAVSDRIFMTERSWNVFVSVNTYSIRCLSAHSLVNALDGAAVSAGAPNLDVAHVRAAIRQHGLFCTCIAASLTGGGVAKCLACAGGDGRFASDGNAKGNRRATAGGARYNARIAGGAMIPSSAVKRVFTSYTVKESSAAFKACGGGVHVAGTTGAALREDAEGKRGGKALDIHGLMSTVCSHRVLHTTFAMPSAEGLRYGTIPLLMSLVGGDSLHLSDTACMMHRFMRSQDHGDVGFADDAVRALFPNVRFLLFDREALAAVGPELVATITTAAPAAVQMAEQEVEEVEEVEAEVEEEEVEGAMPSLQKAPRMGRSPLSPLTRLDHLASCCCCSFDACHPPALRHAIVA